METVDSLYNGNSRSHLRFLVRFCRNCHAYDFFSSADEKSKRHCIWAATKKVTTLLTVSRTESTFLEKRLPDLVKSTSVFEKKIQLKKGQLDLIVIAGWNFFRNLLNNKKYIFDRKYFILSFDRKH